MNTGDVTASAPTTRVGGNPDDVAIREQRSRVAWGNLAAIAVDRHGGLGRCEVDPAAARAARDWRDEVAAALGLHPVVATGPPGICALAGCDKALPLSRAGHMPGGERSPYCSPRCARIATLPSREAPC